MRSRIVSIPAVVMLGLALALGNPSRSANEPAAVRGEADEAAIRTLINEWVRLYNAADFDRLMSSFYTEDCVLLAPGVPLRKGKVALLLDYKKDEAINVEHVESSVVEDMRISGDLAVAIGRDIGTTTPRSTGKTEKYDLKWLMAFERQADGTWKCLYEAWNETPLGGRPEKPMD
jgi:uncharacterized protein (TIGR02246 family)